MRIVIIGQKWLAAELLSICMSRDHQVISVIAPDSQDRLALEASARFIPVQVERARVSRDQIAEPCDVILCAHAHAFITQEARSAAQYGALGFHPSLLPRHRGRDAIRWAIHMREPMTGGTLYWLEDGADTGPIAAQEWCFIRPEDTAQSLWKREIAPMALRMFAKVLTDLERGRKNAAEQDHSLASWEPAFAVRSLKGD